ncbi:MAG: KamA family radical SAM protein [Patescibacteria group bacterium]
MQKSDFIFSIEELEKYLKIPLSSEIKDVHFKLLIPKYYVDLIDWHDPKDPLRLMVLPDAREKNTRKYELADPIGDITHSPVPGIIHRHANRALLNLTSSCAVHCRFCFRKNLLESSAADLQKSLAYLKQHTEIWEVIFSGGDPFTLTDTFLEKILNELRKIPHIKVIRFHTRTPAVYPKRVTSQLAQILRKAAPVTVVLHINHPREITEGFRRSVQKMQKANLMLLSQTVLMRDVNDDVETLKNLFQGLVKIGVKPYYLHHLDYAIGTHYFRVSVEKGKRLVQSLRDTLSGTCIPEYVIDTPGGHGKIPVFWFQNCGKGKYTAKNFQNKKILYFDEV